MKLLLLHDKQLYADFILNSIQNLDPTFDFTLIQSVEDLRSLTDIGEYNLAIVDTGLRDRTSLEAIRMINAFDPSLGVLVIADVSNPSIIADTFKYQVMAYATVNSSPNDLREILLKCLADDRKYTRKTRKNMKNWVNQHTSKVSKIEVSKRERQILRMICEEKTSTEIAVELELSEHTVLTHRKNILKKVSAKNTAGLVKYAIAHKLINI